jgi:hypothetical protein
MEMTDPICGLPWTDMMVLRNGKARVCCHNPLFMGDLNEQTVEEIWHGGNYAKLRDAISQKDFSFGCNAGGCPIAGTTYPMNSEALLF